MMQSEELCGLHSDEWQADQQQQPGFLIMIDRDCDTLFKSALGSSDEESQMFGDSENKQENWLNRSINIEFLDHHVHQLQKGMLEEVNGIEIEEQYGSDQQSDAMQQWLLQVQSSSMNNYTTTEFSDIASSNNMKDCSELPSTEVMQTQKMKQVEWQVVPIIKQISPREIYMLYGELLVEIEDIIQENFLEKNQGYMNFKRVQSVRHRNDNKYTEVVMNSLSRPLREFDFLIARIASIRNKAAQDLAVVIGQYSQLVKRQTRIDEELKLNYSVELLEKRRIHCDAMCEGIIAELDENASVFYCQCQVDPNTLDLVFLKHGYSARLAWIFGCSPEVLGMLYMRYGQINFGKACEDFEMQIKKALMNFKHSNDELAQLSMEFEGSTLDGFRAPTRVVISKIIVSKQFDEEHGIQQMMPECLVVVDVVVDVKWIYLLAQKRCHEGLDKGEVLLGQIQQFSKLHQLQENYEYIEQSQEFLKRYYPELLENQNARVFKEKKVRDTHRAYRKQESAFDRQIDRIIEILDIKQK